MMMVWPWVCIKNCTPVNNIIFCSARSFSLTTQRSFSNETFQRVMQKFNSHFNSDWRVSLQSTALYRNHPHFAWPRMPKIAYAACFYFNFFLYKNFFFLIFFFFHAFALLFLFFCISLSTHTNPRGEHNREKHNGRASATKRARE